MDGSGLGGLSRLNGVSEVVPRGGRFQGWRPHLRSLTQWLPEGNAPGAAKRLRKGGNAVILGGYRNDRVVFRAGSELLAYVWHGCADA